jgi:VHL beta domain
MERFFHMPFFSIFQQRAGAALIVSLVAAISSFPAQAGPTSPTLDEQASSRIEKPFPGITLIAGRRRATGRNVIEVRYPGGVFKKKSGRNWVERNKDGVHRFKETHRDDWSVYLFDASRGIRIQLDLHRREIFFSMSGQPRQVLYRISSATAKNSRNSKRPRRRRVNSCKLHRRKTSRNSNTRVRVKFVNRTNAFRTVMWIDFQGRPKQYASLNPGQSYSVDTFLSHPWMITDGPGNCLEMFMPSRRNKVFNITVPNRNFGPE